MWAEFFFQHVKFLIVTVSIPQMILIYLILRYSQISSAYLSSWILIVLTSLSDISSEIIAFVLKFFLFHSVLTVLDAIALLRDVDLIFSLFLLNFWVSQSLITSLMSVHISFSSRRFSTHQNQLRAFEYDRISMWYWIFLLKIVFIFARVSSLHRVSVSFLSQFNSNYSHERLLLFECSITCPEIFSLRCQSSLEQEEKEVEHLVHYIKGLEWVYLFCHLFLCGERELEQSV